MPDLQFMTLEAAGTKADLVKTALALSKLRLIKSPGIPNQFMDAAALAAMEADFDGYPAGGYPLAAWTGPLNADQGGAVLTSPLVNVTYGPAGAPPVGNEVSGWWVELAGGDVWLVGTFDPVRPLTVVGEGFPLVIQDVEGRNIVPIVEV
jgi:hypothetical protein